MSRRGKQRSRQAAAVPQQRTEGRAVLAKFDLAQTTRENRIHWGDADSLSARASMSPGIRRVIRIRSRYEAANNSWYSGILRTAVNHIAGCGPRLQLLTADQEANTRIERAFTAWAKRIQFADKLRTMVEAYWRDGEVFAMRAERPRNYPMTLDIRTFETEQVASPLLGPLLQDQFVDDGIRFDRQTNEIELHVYDHHPGGNFYPQMTLSGKWYPSFEVLHLFRAERPGQTRGLPRATPALPLLPIMRRQQLAALYSAETAANFAMYLKSNSPAIDPTASPSDFAEIELARNMLTTLPAGWDMGQVDPKQPGPIYESFQDHTLKSFARCTNMPEPLAAGTAAKSNFSSFKGDMRNVWRPEVLSEQNNIEESIVEPIFLWFLESVALLGLLDGLPPIAEIPHRWHWPPLPDIDPLDTANTGAIELASGQKSLTQLHAERGQDWTVEAERAAMDFGVDVATYKAALFNKIFSIEPPPPAGTPQRGGQAPDFAAQEAAA